MLAPGSTIGIIGGGQLGRMLAMAAARLGYATIVLEPDPSCPAAQVATDVVSARYDDADALAELASRSDVVTYEFENVPVGATSRLAARVPVFPPPDALAISQDRLSEKQYLNGIGIATARFRKVDSDADLAAGLTAFSGGILKTRRLGYDGKGQRVLDGDADATGIHAEMGGVPLILEEKVDFTCEISVIAARGRDGATATYDPARNEHRGGILRKSHVPSGLEGRTVERARKAALTLISALDYVGVLGLELFVLADGSVIANEFAPRVHNSGHWTEGACAVSQFEQHIRCVAGLPVADASRHSDCVMENLIGSEVERAASLSAEPGLVLHLYGKRETREGRKMGHFTRLLGPAGRSGG